MSNAHNGTSVIDRVDKRQRLWNKAKKDQTAVIVDACMKVDEVGESVVVIRQEVKKIRYSVHQMRDLVYTLHPEADPDQTFLDKIKEQRYQIAGLCIAFAGAVFTVLGLIRIGVN